MNVGNLVRERDSDCWMVVMNLTPSGQWAECSFYDALRKDYNVSLYHTSNLLPVAKGSVPTPPVPAPWTQESLADAIENCDYPEVLDEYVYGEMADEASNVNSEGCLSQIRYLISRGWYLDDISEVAFEEG